MKYKENSEDRIPITEEHMVENVEKIAISNFTTMFPTLGAMHACLV